MTQAGPTPNPLFDDLKTRSAVALVLALVAFSFLWIGGAVFALFMGAITAVMLIELTRMVKPECELEDIPRAALVAFGGLAVFAIYFSALWFVVLASLGVLLAAVVNRIPVGPVTVAGYAFIVIGGASTLYLRNLGAGFPMLAWIILCVAAADIGGYTFGRLFQGPKLLPRISPKKTWSGFLGGVGLSIVIAIAFAVISGGNLANLVLFGTLIAVVSVAGDLLESSVKRKYGVKDASALLPGHGGFLDRLDGMTAVMVFFAAMSLFVELGEVLAPSYVLPVTAGGL